jgi:hypothetical protein
VFHRAGTHSSCAISPLVATILCLQISIA